MKSEMAIIEQEVRELFGFAESARPDTALAALERYVAEDTSPIAVAARIPAELLKNCGVDYVGGIK